MGLVTFFFFSLPSSSFSSIFCYFQTESFPPPKLQNCHQQLNVQLPAHLAPSSTQFPTRCAIVQLPDYINMSTFLLRPLLLRSTLRASSTLTPTACHAPLKTKLHLNRTQAQQLNLWNRQGEKNLHKYL